jgi:hypothetical protein
MKVAVAGGASALGALVLRRLVADRAVKELVSLSARPPAVAGSKLRWGAHGGALAEHVQDVDALVVVGRLDPGLPVHTGQARVVCVSQEPPAQAAAAATWLRTELVLGAGLGGALARFASLGLMADLGSEPVGLVWGEDVADAVALALKQPSAGTIDLLAGAPTTTRDLALACDLRLVPAGRLGRRGIGPEPPAAPNERARAELGWRPRCTSAAEVVARHRREVPVLLDARIALFLGLLELRARMTEPPREARTITLRIHLGITGARGGDITLSVDAGTLRVRPGIVRPPQAAVWLDHRTFLELCAGRVDFATAQFCGLIRIEGEPLAAMVLQGIFSMFRGASEQPGWRGAAARRLAGWITKGAPA